MRPPKCRYIEHDPDITVFKPRGIASTELSTIEVQLDELEAIRLADYEGLHHAIAGEKMGVSRATFGRILEQARRKIADALLNGKALQFSGGEVLAARKRDYRCNDCGDQFTVYRRSKLPGSCPNCESPKVTQVTP